MSKGILLAIVASTLFGVLYYFSTLLAPLDGLDLFGWRLVLALPFMTVFMIALGEQRQVAIIFQRLRRERALLWVLPVTAALLGVQTWLFMWAPLAGHALEVSLGYFMLPITLVLTGCLLYREKLSGWQLAAVLAAAAGVLHELIRSGGFSWPALLVALGYPPYFILRRKYLLNHLGGLWFDLLLLMPVALWVVWKGQLDLRLLEQVPALWWRVPALSLLTALALTTYFMAARVLPLTLFGLLGYLEPVLLVIVAMILGETLSAAEWLTYAPIWLALGLLAAEGVWEMRRSRANGG
ncbi:EamA family transporter RarD [Lacisediminimonas sp.]|uniref:EamA family transporter RarD n=1 Tax=Lacisediminimonas sp. TaxID=3060582 RepID=UPI00271D3FFF|nr:EamA family transporter RarD [Lacisediminimonas sp.]MDO8300894.1 EamA family transporter RarD [Lacisediminimonas sp.]MDO9217209.1 EamA family transporter RarD [Lacisediminimonas sp.]